MVAHQPHKGTEQPPRILLAVADESRRQAYEEFLAREQVVWHTVSSLREMADHAAVEPCHAILLDMVLIVRSSRGEKILADDALRALPHARLNVSPRSSEIVILAGGEVRGSITTLVDYLRYCRTQPLRLVHPRDRLPLYLHALLSTTPDMAAAERTACLDVSAHGCFLFTAAVDIGPKASVWIQFVTLTDQSPIRATVRWKREWGASIEFPGIGVHMEEMTPGQEAEIRVLLERKRHEQPPGGPGTDSRHLPPP